MHSLVRPDSGRLGFVRLRLALSALTLTLAGCARPPTAIQFVGHDGSRDWWNVECSDDEAACWAQAKAACHDNFKLHELRDDHGSSRTVELEARDGVIPELPSGKTVRGKTLVLTCSSPTVPPAAVGGPECATSAPRANHCDVAAGLAFTTGRIYLAPSAKGSPEATAEAKDAEASEGSASSPALAELRDLADGLAEEAEAAAEPLASVDRVAKAVHDFPSTYRVDAGQW